LCVEAATPGGLNEQSIGFLRQSQVVVVVAFVILNFIIIMLLLLLLF
jgi:hypothetical protein